MYHKISMFTSSNLFRLVKLTYFSLFLQFHSIPFSLWSNVIIVIMQIVQITTKIIFLMCTYVYCMRWGGGVVGKCKINGRACEKGTNMRKIDCVTLTPNVCIYVMHASQNNCISLFLWYQKFNSLYQYIKTKRQI